MYDKKIGIYGCGNMGSAVTNGILSGNVIAPKNMFICDPLNSKYIHFSEIGCNCTTDPQKYVDSLDIIILASKPQQIDDLLNSIKMFSKDKIVISIEAGVTISHIKSYLNEAKIIRVMPNTPLMVGNGVSGISRDDNVTDSEYELAISLFETSGKVIKLSETKLNALTSLTSSSVAYFSRIIDNMVDWAKINGFKTIPDEELVDIVSQVAIGTSDLLIRKRLSPKELERAVTSPKGTTEKAMEIFNDQGLKQIIFKAMDACKERADEMSNNK